jgi:hypothetical protein
MQLESGSMPADYRFRLNKKQGTFLSRPEPSQYCQEELVGCGATRYRMLSHEYRELLPKRKILEHQISARTSERYKKREQ